MIINVAGALCEAGRPGRPNEDGYGTAGRFAWVIDGATGLSDERLTPGASDAAWLTAAMGEAFHAAAGRCDDPGALLAEAAEVTAARFRRERRRAPREAYEIPTAAVLVLHAGSSLRIAELGDCAVWIALSGADPVRFGGTDAGRARETESARRFVAEAGGTGTGAATKTGTGGGRSPALLAHLRAVRSRANTPEGYATFAPDPACIAGLRRHELAGATGHALLLTDGFEAAIDDYGLVDGPGLLAAAHDLPAMLARIRAVEAADPDRRRYPRFKRSDDATALHIRFCP